MSTLVLDNGNRRALADILAGDDTWTVACLCAAWCDVCNRFRPDFEALASQLPGKQLVWIDIEDQAEVVGDFDVENFPTILIQRGPTVVFYGTVLPEARQLLRLLNAQSDRSAEDLAREAQSTPERRTWQQECNLREHLRTALDA